MEDSVAGAESILQSNPVNPSSRDGVQGEEEVDKKEHEAKIGSEQRTSGFINHLISNLVAGDEPEPKPDKERNEENENEQKETVGDQGKVEERRGGLLDHLISNLVSPLSPKASELNQGKGEIFEVNDGGRSDKSEASRSEEEIGASPGGAGVIKNVISNLFHPRDAAAELIENQKNCEEETVKIAEENDEKVKNEEGGGGGIIDNIVSHLPTPLREDVAPTTDEASILIHSIVHD